MPSWQLGKPVSMASLKATTDTLFKSMEPKRKLSAPDVTSPVSDLAGQWVGGVLGEGGCIARLPCRALPPANPPPSPTTTPPI